ncbi:MAG: hypothetical protein JNL32_07490 [Candidatus Kapabacteria bacterium]|nr:hypothetical protein [Candidatus Kapabacteria bacterium]
MTTQGIRRIILGCIAAAAALTFSFGVQSCNRDSNPVSDQYADALYSATLPDADETESDVNECDAATPIAIATPANDGKRIGDFGLKGLRGLRKALNLTADQRAQIKALHQQHEQCFKTVRETLRASEKAIWETYKPQYQAIKTSLQNATIDSATAKQQFKALSQQLRDALKNNPARATAKQDFINCRTAFFDAVKGVLTPEQIEAFEDWAAQHRRK